jgi:GNAT superfamily N-acetyltransferase
MAIEIRKVDNDRDFRHLHDLYIEYEGGLPPDLRHGPVPDAAALRDACSGTGAAFIATSEGTAIGCVAVTAVDRDTGLLRHLFVTPESRGLGAARSLVTAAIALSRARGFRRVVLDTEKEQLNAAYLLYRSLGFEECEPHGVVDYASPTFMELLL